MDIFDIQVEKITEQYLEYIKSQESMNLEVDSEYLVMASELIEVKSKLLLPREKETEDLEVVDPREELVNRLLEYESYKEITKTLKEKEQVRMEIYTKAPSDMTGYIEENMNLGIDVTLDDLVDAFQKFLERQKEAKPLATKVTENEITVSSRRLAIKSILKKERKISFFKLFPVFSKEYVVATFLAVLEMVKNKELIVTQNDTFDDIICEVRS